MEILLFPNKFFDIMEHYMFEIKKKNFVCGLISFYGQVFTLMQVMKGVLTGSRVDLSAVCSLGISCQRATFVNWSKSNGR